MNNRYVFRGKRIDNNEWVAGSLLTVEDSCRIATSCLQGDDDNLLDNVCAYTVFPESVMQCTGRCYSNGKPMFEGDIVKDEQSEEYSIIKWFSDYTAYALADSDGEIRFGVDELDMFIDDLVAVGNTYDDTIASIESARISED